MTCPTCPTCADRAGLLWAVAALLEVHAPPDKNRDRLIAALDDLARQIWADRPEEDKDNGRQDQD